MKTILLATQLCFMVTLTCAQCPATYTDTINKILHDGINCIDYPIVKIGNQWWMKENVNATLYADSTSLVDGTGAGNISGDYTTKYYFNYDDDTANGKIYGKLYTWAAIMNGAKSSNTVPSGVQGVCPDGWHIPSDEEWKQLEIEVGMSKTEADLAGWRGTDISKKLKEVGTSHWLSNTGTTNSSGFTALPGGTYYNGSFSGIGNNGNWWTATENGTSKAWMRLLHDVYSEVFRYDLDKAIAYSVRCAADINTATSGGDISFKSNAIKIYPNPSLNGKFVINSKNSITSLEIYNVLGKLVFSQSVSQSKAGESITIDLCQQNPGIYFVKAYRNHKVSTQKVINASCYLP